ncbi:MAG TPA: cupin domain-containing protein [Thermodesulfobacteriota bacterium]
MTARKARVVRFEEVDWRSLPGHVDAFSKLLVHPTNADTTDMDFRVSTYRPRGYAEVHAHGKAEHVYYVVRGTGTIVLEGERHVAGPNTTIHVPPGVSHGIVNTGLDDLVLIVVSVPAADMPAVA